MTQSNRHNKRETTSCNTHIHTHGHKVTLYEKQIIQAVKQEMAEKVLPSYPVREERTQ